MSSAPRQLYRAWTRKFDLWFAVPGTVRMDARGGSVFYFETQFRGARHPHCGRFTRLVHDSLIEMTWVTAATKGFETTVTVNLTPRDGGTRLRLTQTGFPDLGSKTRHRKAWPKVLSHLDAKLKILR
jgi:uncharacterized protein YndB with AHSA1/START domain